MHTLPIDVNRRQLNKLMKGHRVRIKKGTGFNLIVHPERYSILSRAFAKNKGSEVQLTPEEIQANQYDDDDDDYETEARRMGNIGQGIRGCGAIGDMLKQTAANATANLINAGSDRAANEMTTQGTGFRRSRGGSLKDTVAQVQLANELNNHLGTNYGYLSRAGLDNAINKNKSVKLNELITEISFICAVKLHIELVISSIICCIRSVTCIAFNSSIENLSTLSLAYLSSNREPSLLSGVFL